MKKTNTFYFVITLFITLVSNAQIGVGNTSPKATLDVNKASYTTGEQAGIAVTQLTGAQVIAMSTSGLKAGTLVYVTSTSGIITSIGFWNYNGSAWVKVGGDGGTVTGSAPINVASGVVSLNNAGVNTAKLADNAVTSAKILDSSIETADVADNAITAAKIANNAVTVAKLPTGATASTFLRGDGTWATPTTPTTPGLAITVPTTNDYTVLETDAVIYRTLTANGTITFPSTLPAGKVFYISNNSTYYDWNFSPLPINTGVAQVFAGYSHMIVTLGGGQILVVSGN